MITFKDNELNEYIDDMLEEWEENGTLTKEWKEDLHFHLFNEDYYMIGTHKATQWLNGEVFNVIHHIHQYEIDNFGCEGMTDFSNAEQVVNMFAYVRGEELLIERGLI